MIKDLTEVLEKVRSLPEERQRYLVRVIEELVGESESYNQLTDEERRLVQEGLDAADAGRIVPDAEMDAFWNRHDR